MPRNARRLHLNFSLFVGSTLRIPKIRIPRDVIRNLSTKGVIRELPTGRSAGRRDGLGAGNGA